MKVKDCMCNEVCCVKPETKISEVAKIMGENHIGCIPVCDNNNSLCGIVTDRDIILRCVACKKDVNSSPVSDIMSTNVQYCAENDTINKAQDIMSQNKVRRLPVCDEQNNVVGILTIGDLAQNDIKVGKENVCNTISNICNSHTQNAE